MCAGGCTWQWLQRTLQQPVKQSSVAAPSVSPPQEPSHAHELHIQNQHIKHTRRLLRLFRRALSKQTLITRGGSSAMHGSGSQTQTPATAPRKCNPTCTELTAISHTASSSVAASNCTPSGSFRTASGTAAAPDLAAAQPPSALREAASAADTDSTADHATSASTQAKDGITAGGSDSSSTPHSASINKAALFSQARPSAQSIILVEAIIPDHQLAANSCHAPYLFNLSVTPQALASYYPGSTLQLCASAAFPEGIDAQRALAESLVQHHMQRSESDEKGSTPIQLSSSIKVSQSSLIYACPHMQIIDMARLQWCVHATSF